MIMNSNVDRFLATIKKLSHELTAAHEKTVEYWLPDHPPITIAFSEIGCCLADDFEKIEKVARERIFLLIEDGVASDDEELGTAVATGLIEGMVVRAITRGNWDSIAMELGPLSKSHAEAWIGNPEAPF